jgi:HlyD family secretion protein
MKHFFFWAIGLALTIGAGTAAYNVFHVPQRHADCGAYRTVAVRRGDVTQIVQSTGTVQPVQSVKVGTFVSGPIQKVEVDFNALVKKGQILAEVDPLINRAQRNQAHALLLHALADLGQYQARLIQAEGDLRRAKRLRPDRCSSARRTNIEFHALSDSDYDMTEANYAAAKSIVDVAKSTIEQNQASLELAETNLAYTVIRSPVDGVVIDRRVDPGQTVASQFQTPVLFVVAPDLQKKVHVYASVDEADIGLIREAQTRNGPVAFTVDAYPYDTFRGKIVQVRLNPTTVQNVVTYTVVVEASNPQLKLLPGMTASLFFQIEKRQGRLVLPNAALRFYPNPDEVCERDRLLAESMAGESPGNPEGGWPHVSSPLDEAGCEPMARDKLRYLWVLDEDEDQLSAVPVTTGLSDNDVVEIASGSLSVGQEVVVGATALSAK